MMLVGLMMAFAAADSAPLDPVDVFFAEFADKRAHIQVLEATFERKNITPDETFATKGKLLYAKPRRIILRHDDTEVPDLMLDAERIFEHDRDMEQLEIHHLRGDVSVEALFVGFEAETNRLREAYDVELFDPVEEEGAAKGLVLRPKKREGEEEAALFERVRLFLRKGDYLPCRIVIVNDSDSRTDTRITNFIVNHKIDPKTTQIFLKEGTVIIEDEESVDTAPPGGLRLPTKAIAPKLPEPKPVTVEAP